MYGACTRATALLGALAMGLGPRPGLAAAAGTQEAPMVETTTSEVQGLRIWIGPTVPDGEQIRRWVEERAEEVLERRGAPLGPEDMIHLTVLGEPYAYQVHVALVRGKRLLAEHSEVVICECGTDEMLVQVGEAIEAGAQMLAEAPSPPVPPPAVEVEQDTGDAVNDGVRRPLGAMGYAGIAVGVLGVGALVSGVVLALRPDEIRSGSAATRYTTRPPGIGLAIGGSAALTAGITLIVWDAVVRKKSRMAVVPAVDREQAGLSIVRRF